MNDWKELPLGNFLSFGNGKKRPDTEGLIPIYGGNGILGYTSNNNYDGETIVIGRVGAYCGSVYFENKPIWVSDNALSAKPKDKYNAKFLYYFLKFINLNQYAGGSSHPLVTQTLLNSLEFELCVDPDEQKAIASVLSSLDDKIDLLHRQNKTLEAMAETLFRQWFVEEAEDDWEETTLGNLGKIITGKTPSTKNKEYWGNHIDFITPTDFKNYGKYTFSSERGLSLVGKEKINNIILPKNSILVTCIGSDMGKVVITTKEGVTNQQINSIIINTNLISVEYVYQYLKSIYYLLRNIALGGTTMPIINKTDFSNIETPIPPNKPLKKYNMITSEFNKKILYNTNQIQTLEKLRDTLLPKLMSGEIRVKY
ncbi:MAG: type I restriction enzyme, S subunit [Candidatus Magnetoglobus multicellularis str. Araruama]|uniref:Type I restriction enzyme, S subunit n=1 Tax=Candidatus Magnetoglobus multicellularis str. Araruama TaxID=890399 RepID=A0A1V1NZM6_9BACT|nr:MAG: type I restriction enzyme, S subunit [Candidatus Magnetoglobus multicellularis str. Araruama]